MKFVIYRTTNKINGKIYIGKHKTADLADDYLGSGKRLQLAIQKYGVENFEREILHILDSEEAMNAKEREIVNEEFLKRDDVYNLKLGGDGGFDYLNRNGLNNANKDWELRATQQSKVAKKMWSDPIYRDWHREKNKRLHSEGRMKPPSFTGKTHSDSTKALLSEKGKRYIGAKNSQFGSFWITNGITSQKLKQGEIIPDGWYRGRKL